MGSSGLTVSKKSIFLIGLFWLNFDVGSAKNMLKHDSDTFWGSKTFTFVETQGNFVFGPKLKKIQYGRQGLLNYKLARRDVN